MHERIGTPIIHFDNDSRIRSNPPEVKVESPPQQGNSLERAFREAQILKSDIERRFQRQIEQPHFTIPGVLKRGINPTTIRERTILLAQDIIHDYGPALSAFPRDAFHSVTSVLSENPERELPPRRISVQERANLLTARILARTGVDTKSIAEMLQKDWEVVNHWTQDIRIDLQTIKKNTVRELVQRGVAVYKVSMMLQVGNRTVTQWCEDILQEFDKKKQAAIEKERQLAQDGFWPGEIARFTGQDRSTIRLHTGGLPEGKVPKRVVNERKKEIRRVMNESKQRGIKITQSHLSRETGLHRDTIRTYLRDMKIRLDN